MYYEALNFTFYLTKYYFISRKKAELKEKEREVRKMALRLNFEFVFID